jgi:hypothetical protein
MQHDSNRAHTGHRTLPTLDTRLTAVRPSHNHDSVHVSSYSVPKPFRRATHPAGSHSSPASGQQHHCHHMHNIMRCCRCIVLAVLCVAVTTHARPVSGGQRGGRASHVGGQNSSSDVFNVVNYGAVGDDRWVLETIQLTCTHKVTEQHPTATATCCTSHPTHLSPLNCWCSWHTSSSA